MTRAEVIVDEAAVLAFQRGEWTKFDFTRTELQMRPDIAAAIRKTRFDCEVTKWP